MSLEIWEAVRYETVLDKSRTKPLVLECERRDADAGDEVAAPLSPLVSAKGLPLGATPSLILPTGAKGNAAAMPKVESRLFVVKSLGHPEVLESTLFQEVFGNLLARFFGLSTPEPALIALGDAFVQVTQPRIPPQTNIRLRPGWGVGCAYMPPLIPLVPDFRLIPALLPAAALIFAFDLLVANPDRSFQNPNCSLRDNTLIAYDFECAFSFLMAVLGPPPWQISKLGIAHRHVFQAELKRQGAVWAPFLERLNKLDASAMHEMVKDLPPEWLTKCGRVFDYLLDARDAVSKLQRELDESLRVLK